ncbi:MAG: PQQ-binding-like beta-propeller repeat protein [Acidobacteriota bacterium]
MRIRETKSVSGCLTAVSAAASVTSPKAADGTIQGFLRQVAWTEKRVSFWKRAQPGSWEERSDMSTVQAEESTTRKPLRLWPGVAAVVLQWLVRFVVPMFRPDAAAFAIIGGIVGGLVVVLWWLFFSRAPWSERLGALVLMVAGLFGTSYLVHESIANGMMGMLLPILAVPILSLALVVWAVASRRLATKLRRVSMVAGILLACGVFALLRTGGITGDADSDLHWRWTETPEERLLAQAVDEPVGLPSAPTAVPAPQPQVPTQTADQPAAPTLPPATAPTSEPARPQQGIQEPMPPVVGPPGAKRRVAWPGFRGPERDSVIHGVRIATDWSRSAPVELWRRAIGPGWSSFAVSGSLIYTQEQRGDDEMVSCYNLSTGLPVWRHRDTARFWESNAGAGPRATPSVSNGRVYTLGATGLLNALDARNGSVIWSRNTASDTGKKVPEWGFASSPLVFGDLVVAAAAGRVAAYDLTTGNLRWLGPTGGWGYSSPHLATIDGVAQIVLLNGAGAISVAPDDGALLWNYAWPGDGIVQPAVMAGDVLIGSGSGLAKGVGVRRVSVGHESGEWSVEERWTSTALKPYFNDFVVHQGHAFGFDGSILACINLEDGKRKWKGGRYGHGQLVLLADQDLLLVLSEEGELALVAAGSDQFRELARFSALEGKTWNHPVLAGDVLLVRNGQEMAAFRISLASN